MKMMMKTFNPVVFKLDEAPPMVTTLTLSQEPVCCECLIDFDRCHRKRGKESAAVYSLNTAEMHFPTHSARIDFRGKVDQTPKPLRHPEDTAAPGGRCCRPGHHQETGDPPLLQVVT
ncbi:hypothetical protein JOQ06_007264 [Pogonophryne albipinna]|uniref:Uncharacterized protein n=1 Tax=Pogonophryne albipinna TaxID=1090488 RepID=A0AAD6AYK9_9TELE|nr:hypothetical protein JOQ06_007264 [Pogonophryne albipinna]